MGLPEPIKHSQRARRRAFSLAAALLALFVGLGSAHADNVDKLALTLESSTHDKARIAAAVSLGRLKDERALGPLVKALRDEHRAVRAVAAAALGHLGDPKALPALQRATKDDDKLVRRRATEAIAAIRASQDRAAVATRGKARSSKKARAGFGAAAITAEPAPARPTMLLALQSTADESKGQAPKKLRKARADKLRTLLAQELAATSTITLDPNKAEELGLARFNIDVSIMRLEENIAGPFVEVECQLRVAISNDRGKMLSFLTGGAKVQIPRKTYNSKYLTRLQIEAMENAVKGVYQDVLNHLARHHRI